MHDWIAPGIFIAVLILGTIGIVRAISSPAPPPMASDEDEKYCPSCGTVGVPQFRKSGSTSVAVVLWLLGILPGLIYSIWRASTKRYVCPKCEQTGVIPLDSPKAVAALSNQGLANR